MTKKLTLSIPKPCHEDWDKMTRVEKGKFCGSCEKEVIDFTRMSESDLIAFFKKPAGSVCGRFRNNQLENDIYIRPKRIPWVKYFFQIALPAFLISCKQKTVGLPVLKTETVIDSAVSSETFTMGKPAPAIAVDSGNLIKGELNVETVVSEEFIYGDTIVTVADTNETVRPDTAETMELPEIVLHDNNQGCSTRRIVDWNTNTMGLIAIEVQPKNAGDSSEKNDPLRIENSLKIYPNPLKRNSTAIANVAHLPAGHYKLQVADMGGRIIYSKEIMVEKYVQVEIPFLKQPAGMYTVSFINQALNKVYNGKIIVQ